MKIRNGFVSNSSSCSYVVDLGKPINTPKDLEYVLNKNFWKDARKTDLWNKEDNKNYNDLEGQFPFEKICQFLFSLLESSDYKESGKWLLDELIKEYKDEDLESFPKFRANLLRTSYGKQYYKDRLNSEYFDERFDVEEEIWERYKRKYKILERICGIEELRETGKNLAYFSFGNESDYFLKEEKFSDSEKYFISVLRNYGLARCLFKGLRWMSEDYS